MPDPYDLINGSEENFSEKEIDKSVIFDPNYNIFDNLDKFKTIVNQQTNTQQIKGGSKHAKRHIHLTKKLHQWTFDKSDFGLIHNLLEENMISNIHKDRIIKMFHNFNKGMVDPSLFSIFIELQGYLQEIIGILEDFKRSKLTQEKKHEYLGEFVNIFEHAYKNRVPQSFLIGNRVTDSNLDYNGGIQQIISGFDLTYKSLIKGIYGHSSYNTLVCVAGFNGISTRMYDLRINYSHIYVVQSFLSVIMKESANFFLDRIHFNKSEIDSPYNDNIKQLFEFSLPNRQTYSNLKTLRAEYLSSFRKAENKINGINNFIYYLLNDVLFSTLFADYVTYQYGFLGDIELLLYWYWSNFLQTPIHYNKDGSINQEYFVVMLFRVLILLIDNHKIKQINDIKTKPPSEKLSVIWKTHFDDVYKSAIWISNNRQYKEWHKSSNEVNNSLFANAVHKTFKEKDSKAHFDAIIDKDYPKAIKIYEDCRTDFIKIIKLDSVKFMKKIEEGQTIEYSATKINSYQKHLLTLIYSYLKSLKSFNNNKIIVLNKNDIQQSNTNADKHSEILIDPYDGIFMPSNNTKKEQFKRRCSIINSLIDFSLKYKKDLFTEDNKSVNSE